ncbi:MAG: hypothetical protein GQ557_00120, partial [Mycoplasmataceae bacterium]|nr:hypothetical protein [Mycoplasmataceae bacterium]
YTFLSLLDEIISIKKYYANGEFNKVKKHKILYFLNGLDIFLQNNLSIYKNKETKFLIINGGKKMQWLAFARGPVLDNEYQIGFEDKNIISINTSIDEGIMNFFEISLLSLLTYDVNKLIKESHDTKPFFECYKGQYRDEIPNEIIINYFKVNMPFFMKGD